jgi:RNA polymerase sigma-70 factor (ECF subfamily)
MDDREIIGEALRGRREAFRRLMTEYAPAALALAINVLGNRQDAEDACQEAFLQVYRHLHRYDPGQSFKNWLYAILYRRCLDFLRRRRRASRIAAKMRTQLNAERDSAPSASSSRSGLDPEWLGRLSARERAALALWAVDGFSSQEIGRALGCTSGTARVTLFQARKKIKSLLLRDTVQEGMHADLPRR